MKKHLNLFFCLQSLMITAYPLLGKPKDRPRKITEENVNTSPQTPIIKTIPASMIEHIDQAIKDAAVDSFCATKVAHVKDGKLTILGNVHSLNVQPWLSEQDKKEIIVLRQEIKDGKFAFAPTSNNGKHSESFLVIGLALTRLEEQKKPITIAHILKNSSSKL